MEVLYRRCAGLDVHARQVTACLRLASGPDVTYQHQTFATTTRGLLALAEWLAGASVTHVAMEATGVYWKPVWHVLESQCTLILANARHIRHVPGRKSDMTDAAWIADLLAHGLVRNSFVPPTPVQELRDLTRTRKQLVREITRHTQRMQKTLEDANIKLAQVVTDPLGKSARAILRALIAGETDAERLADLTAGRLKAPRAQLVDALHGRVTAHHRFLLDLHLTQVEVLEAAITKLEGHLGTAMAPFQAAVSLLTTMPGLGDTAARTLLAEVGTDMRRFPTAGHLVSWAGLCPRLDVSAGKRHSTRIRPTTPWLKTTLVQTAWAATRKRDSYLRAQFLRLKSRRGPKKAIIAVAASMLTAAYYMLRDGVEYRDAGSTFLTAHDKAETTKRLLRRLQKLGVDVEIKTQAA